MTDLTPVTIRQCINAVAAAHDIEPSDILSKSRKKAISHARHEAMYEARRITGKSYPTIARVFNVDHSSVIYGVTAHAERSGLPRLSDVHEGFTEGKRESIQVWRLKRELCRARQKARYWKEKANENRRNSQEEAKAALRRD